MKCTEKGILSCQDDLDRLSQSRNLKLPLPITVKLDPDVAAVLSFMVENFKANKLVDIANGIKELAGPLWSRHRIEPASCEKGFISVSLTRHYPSDKDET